MNNREYDLCVLLALAAVLGGCQAGVSREISASPFPPHISVKETLPTPPAPIKGHVVERIIKVYEDNDRMLCDEFDNEGVQASFPRVYDVYCGAPAPVVIHPAPVECPVTHKDLEELGDSYINDVRGKANEIEQLRPFRDALCDLPRDKNGVANPGSSLYRDWLDRHAEAVEKCE